jgi:hypothetical protein
MLQSAVKLMLTTKNVKCPPEYGVILFILISTKRKYRRRKRNCDKEEG